MGDVEQAFLLRTPLLVGRGNTPASIMHSVGCWNNVRSLLGGDSTDDCEGIRAARRHRQDTGKTECCGG